MINEKFAVLKRLESMHDWASTKVAPLCSLALTPTVAHELCQLE